MAVLQQVPNENYRYGVNEGHWRRGTIFKVRSHSLSTPSLHYSLPLCHSVSLFPSPSFPPSLSPPLSLLVSDSIPNLKRPVGTLH